MSAVRDCYIYAKTDSFDEDHKDEIVDAVCALLLGKKILTPTSSASKVSSSIRRICASEWLDNPFFSDEFAEEDLYDSKLELKIRNALEKKYDIYLGHLDFEMSDETYEKIMSAFLKAMKKASKTDFTLLNKLEFSEW